MSKDRRCCIAAVPSPCRVRRPVQAFTLIEVLLALFVMLMMTLMFAAVSVTATRATLFGSSYNQAVSLAQHKIDQLQELGFNDAKDVNRLVSSKIVDASPAGVSYKWPTKAPVSGDLAKANGVITGYFNNVDNLGSYFTTGKSSSGAPTAASVEGRLEIRPYPSRDAATMYKATIILSWQVAGQSRSEYRTESVLTRDATFEMP